ncbi:coiled-coil domain-containing protein 50 [Tribolium castaneum]|uniref:Coiled-coil domain-containing protein n=1 Tax=Tribolium castaneum TaxID=7070 RepID=D6WGU9_TRICA|nr:PREDICTED: uncharacterized protein LOC655846 [Tribolium castaneum]EFA00964.1 hypothetical protein TcasGA2_TC003874 [Tribolium castaneum]|eukprot:XP_967502.1 PREDICTED: uncharacterized protein LOC655846 [Tribolium castaneum]
MSEAKVRDNEALPKGRVTEVCQEWMVREDGALAYRLQNQEITEHLSGNKYRNALVREDFPRAKSEQLREQQLAEQTALIYQRMLAEQEEQDNQVAKQLAEELEREERQKRRFIEIQDQNVARQLLHRERVSVERHALSPQRPPPPRNYDQNLSPHRPNSANYQANLPRRQAKPMPLPSDLYTEPYRTPEALTSQLERIDIAEVGLPLDELTERQIQEERDAELARKLQEQEGSLEDTLLNRDRMLAIEAQDKELAKMLQERERSKARRARERAKQKALAKKQLESQQSTANQIMPDDAYSYPADMIPPRASVPRNHPIISDTYALPNQNEDDINYSLPADVLPSHNLIDNNVKSNYSPQKSYDSRYALGDKVCNSTDSSIRPSFDTDRNLDGPPAVRPTQLDLKSPLNRINKPRYPEPEGCDNASGLSPNSQHINIAMAIDPTYPKRGMHSSSSYETTSSTVTTSTSSSSPGMVLPPPDISELDDENNIPPYMPIQGQRRTASLEKKQKKKSKDGGCKQQ